MNIKKPQSAFQYYIKAWKNLSDEDKKIFEDEAWVDKIRYEKEKLEKELEEEEEVTQQQIYLRAYTGGYSAVGLDNGAKSYDTVGPVVKIIEYSKEEQEKWGVKVKVFEYRDINSTKQTLQHNQKYHIYSQYGDPTKKGTNVYTYGTRYNHRNDRPYHPRRKYRVVKDEESPHVGLTTHHYNSFNNSSWTTHH